MYAWFREAPNDAAHPGRRKRICKCRSLSSTSVSMSMPCGHAKLAPGIMILLYPTVVSKIMRARPEPRVAAVLDSIADDGLGLASATVSEVLDGIGRFDPGRRQRDLADRFQDLLDVLFKDRIVERSLADAQACAKIMEEKRLRSESLDDHMLDAFLAPAHIGSSAWIPPRACKVRNATTVMKIKPRRVC